MLAIGGRFGATYRAAGWQAGLTILTAMGNLLPNLRAEDQALALYHGLVHVARDSAGQPPRFALTPLPEEERDIGRLGSWFRRFIEVRDADGAERALLTAIAAGHRRRRWPASWAPPPPITSSSTGGTRSTSSTKPASCSTRSAGTGSGSVILPSLIPVLA